MTHWRETCAIKSFVVRAQLVDYRPYIKQWFKTRNGMRADTYEADGVLYREGMTFMKYVRRTEIEP